ncbi:glycine cleavage system protein H [Thermoplasma volcanium GSS1]|uniref:Probable glycine cleavage system H protein n=1 Tax=Thermoplasma volcanium (strain ATCC 51530 / DSM 4299 / JCM 9571 / NBRC 15438 / GSS1) TaxID=273116 RepID=GCSH_THEVO|nr:glycine cleavage system protein GcvH [Thermoplasma volcanium]Q97C14.1 RecName: Full=Probable glycine cleavage system H protein [Thermoplasma volcanium GSS1]BAB59433.1 glycine cleavage system protein H [Thermoplasma volcanium GSS1]
MTNVPDGLKYTKTHEWYKVDNGIATVGITDYAQSQMTDIVYVDLPEVGDKKKVGDVLLTIESVKSAEDVYSPLTGEITEVNQELTKHPENINKDPYGNWLVKMKVEKEGEYLTAEQYRKLIQ